MQHAHPTAVYDNMPAPRKRFVRQVMSVWHRYMEKEEISDPGERLLLGNEVPTSIVQPAFADTAAFWENKIGHIQRVVVGVRHIDKMPLLSTYDWVVRTLCTNPHTMHSIAPDNQYKRRVLYGTHCLILRMFANIRRKTVNFDDATGGNEEDIFILAVAVLLNHIQCDLTKNGSMMGTDVHTLNQDLQHIEYIRWMRFMKKTNAALLWDAVGQRAPPLNAAIVQPDVAAPPVITTPTSSELLRLVMLPRGTPGEPIAHYVAFVAQKELSHIPHASGTLSEQLRMRFLKLLNDNAPEWMPRFTPGTVHCARQNMSPSDREFVDSVAWIGMQDDVDEWATIRGAPTDGYAADVDIQSGAKDPSPSKEDDADSDTDKEGTSQRKRRRVDANADADAKNTGLPTEAKVPRVDANGDADTDESGDAADTEASETVGKQYGGLKRATATDIYVPNVPQSDGHTTDTDADDAVADTLGAPAAGHTLDIYVGGA